jgi:DNA-directed RNA polymerase alpha subunit
MVYHQNSTKTDFFLISKEYTIENSTSFYGCFYLGPFETGEGLTISNTLRRTLLTCVGGLSITAVEIEGVRHEYSSIPGLKETVLDLLLSMNDIVFTTQKSNFSLVTPPQIGYLKKRGPGVIYAQDLRLPPGICCVNPTHIIGTLSDIGHLNMKFEIQYGKNWKETKSQLDKANRQESSEAWLKRSQVSRSPLSFERILRESTGQPPNNVSSEAIPLLNNSLFSMDLNPVFNPIKKVNYIIESLNDSSIITTGLFQQILTGELSQSIDKDNAPILGENSLAQEKFASTRLYMKNLQNSPTKNQLEIIVLEIWTNGSIHPRDALSIALRKCVTTFSKLAEIPCL